MVSAHPMEQQCQYIEMGAFDCYLNAERDEEVQVLNVQWDYKAAFWNWNDLYFIQVWTPVPYALLGLSSLSSCLELHLY